MTGWWPIFHNHALGLRPAEVCRLHWRANLLMLRQPKAIARFTLVSLLPTPLLIFAATLAVDGIGARAPLGSALLPNASPMATLVLATGAFLLYLVLQHLAFRSALKHDYMPYVRQALAQSGLPVCMKCGHLLAPVAKGSTAAATPPQCPECGYPTSGGQPACG